MKILTNQTLYQCDYCGKRLLSAAGAKLHEEKYCSKSPQLLEEGLKVIMQCNHHWTYSYSLIPGEDYVQEPDYQYCTKCHVRKHEIYEGVWSAATIKTNVAQFDSATLITAYRLKHMD